MRNFCRKIINNSKFELLSLSVVLLTLFIFVLSTELKSSKWFVLLRVTDFIFAGIFIVEYILRFGASKNKLSTICKPMMVIDLIVIISLLYPHHYNLISLRLLKLFHFFFRSKRFKTAKIVIRRVIKVEKEELIMIFLCFFFIVFTLSSLTYFVESSTPKLSSIPECIYWVMITATSVGYGDVVPFTAFGKIIAVLAATTGLITYSIMTAVFASGFTAEMKKIKK